MFFYNKTLKNYRSEIDGLRAIAVFSVIFFHADLFFFKGGYVGVDIFFVISGYLITKLIVIELYEKKFSIVTFYERRVRRIIPALYFLILICIPISAFYLITLKSNEFLKMIISIIGFFSNIYFWKTSGYFDTDSELKPFLHTWSLSLEEQFYFFFPIFILIIWKFSKNYLLIFIISIFFLSFFLAEFFVYTKPIASFFLLPTRGWEFLVGSIVYFIEKKQVVKFKYPNFFSTVGFFFISVSIFLFNKETFTPSYLTLLPTIGTALVILFSKKIH